MEIICCYILQIILKVHYKFSDGQCLDGYCRRHLSILYFRFHQVFSAKGRKLVYVGQNATMVTLTSYFIRIQPCYLSFHINVNEFLLNTTLRNISEVWPTLIPHNFSNYVHAWIITLCYTTADIPLVGLFTHVPTTPMLRTRKTPHIYLIKY